jgi:hypothetical protein
MLARGGKDKKRFLFQGHHNLRFAGMMMILQVIDFAFPKDESFGLYGPFLKGDPTCHVLDILHDEIYRNPVVPKARNRDICVDSGR